ncbi:hypothetical protein [Reyranella massiliensis]|uniref:hypothetical protein n=1 Tax=Reyranella massiliensis TaxID=445220 RepID=UPI0002E2D48C|nr:hypothetical protein [Reyranella massiliensis]
MRAFNRFLCAVALVLFALPAMAQNKVPPDRALEALVKATLLTFNDANVSGNYDIFHAKAAKPFRDQFTPEQLKATFNEFNKKSIDFDIIAAMTPIYAPKAAVDGDGKLIVKGYFPTEPSRLTFELEFIPSDAQWKMIRIYVKTEPKTEKN